MENHRHPQTWHCVFVSPAFPNLEGRSEKRLEVRPMLSCEHGTQTVVWEALTQTLDGNHGNGMSQAQKRKRASDWGSCWFFDGHRLGFMTIPSLHPVEGHSLQAWERALMTQMSTDVYFPRTKTHPLPCWLQHVVHAKLMFHHVNRSSCQLMLLIFNMQSKYVTQAAGHLSMKDPYRILQPSVLGASDRRHVFLSASRDINTTAIAATGTQPETKQTTETCVTATVCYPGTSGVQ